MKATLNNVNNLFLGIENVILLILPFLIYVNNISSWKLFMPRMFYYHISNRWSVQICHIFFFPEALHRQSRHWLESKYFTQWMLNILLKPAKGILKENRWHCKTNSSELLVGKKKREDHCSLHNGLFGDRKGQNVDWGCEILYKEKEILLLINFLQKANFDMCWSYTQHLSKFCLSHKDLLLKPSKVRSYWKKNVIY